MTVDKNMPKLANIDSDKLSLQINKVDIVDHGVQNRDKNQPEFAVPARSCLKKANNNNRDSKKTVRGSTLGSNNLGETGSVPLSNTAKVTQDMGLVKSDTNLDSKSGNFSRRRKFDDSDKSDDNMGGIMKDLEKPVIPSSNQALKRRKIEESKESAVPVSMAKAKRKKQRHQKRANGEEISDSESASSDGTVSSHERDELMTKYLKKLLGPIFQEQRELNKKDIQDLLDQTQSAKSKARPSQVRVRAKYNPEDPFLEDEGFAPSDNSQVSVSPRSAFNERSISNKTSAQKEFSGATPERKNSRKLSRSSQSQDRKTMGTPKRISSTADLQKPIIAPSELSMHQRQSSKTGLNLTKNDSVISEISNKDIKKPVSTDVEVGASVFVEPKNMIFSNSNSGEKKLEKQPSETMKPSQTIKDSNSLFAPKKLTDDMTNKDSDKNESSDTPKTEKPKVSLFGQTAKPFGLMKQPSKTGTEESPSFLGSNKDKEPESSTTEKKTSIFKTSTTTIPEEKNEDKKEDAKKPASLFGTTKKPEAAEKKPSSTENPFTQSVSSDMKKPVNLFAAPAPAAASQETKSKPAKVSIFGAKDASAPQTSLFGTPKPATGAGIFKDKPKSDIPPMPAAASTGQDEDVGMGGVTPPAVSPNLTPVQSTNTANYQYKRAESATGMPGQGSGESKPSGGIFNKPVTGSIFKPGGTSTSLFNQESAGEGKNPLKNAPASLFSMGATNGKPARSSGSSSLFSNAPAKPMSLFASAPSQGQPNSTKQTGWSTDPFGGKPKNKNNDDDGLFNA